MRQAHACAQSSSSASGKAKANFHGSVAVLSTHKRLWHLWQCQEPTYQPALTAWLAHAWGAGKLPLYNCIPCQPVTSQAQPEWELTNHRPDLLHLLYPLVPHPLPLSPRSAHSLSSYLPLIFVFASVGVAPLSKLLHLYLSTGCHSDDSAVKEALSH